MADALQIRVVLPEALSAYAQLSSVPDTGGDAHVRNSDDSYTAAFNPAGVLTIPDIDIGNSNASYGATYPAAKDYTIPNTPIVNTDGDSIGSAPSAAEYEVGDSHIRKASNVVLYNLPATDDITTTAIIALMSEAEVRADLVANGRLDEFIQNLTGGSGDLSNLTQAQIQALTASQIANLTLAQVQSLTTTQIGYLSAAQIAVLANTQLANLTATQLQYIVQNLVTNAQFNTWLSYTQRNNLGNIGTLQTGITTSQVAHDDGDYEYGRLASFSVLKQNNAFGNTSRFTSEAGNQNYVNNYLIDHATGLGWYLVTQAAATWQNAIIGAEAASFQIGAGGPTYSDWILPNINQLLSLRNYSDSFGYPAFSSNNNNWSSSEDPALPATRALFTGQRGRVNEQDMTTLTPYKICRFHYT